MNMQDMSTDDNSMKANVLKYKEKIVAGFKVAKEKVVTFYKFVDFIYSKRDVLWKEFNKLETDKASINNVVDFITRTNDTLVRTKKRTLKEEDRIMNDWMAGVIDADAMNKACRDAYKLKEEEKGERIKMGELWE